MAATQFYLPYQAAVKPTNIGAPGAKLYVYVPGTTTLRPVYSTSSLTTQLSNPVIADGAGKWPDIYLDGALTYKIVITDKAGTQLYSKDPYIPGVAPDASALAPYQAAAESAATSASGSAASASSSQVAAATSATSASNSATSAANSATAAAGSASSAATSASSAGTSSAIATTQAGLAAGSASLATSLLDGVDVTGATITVANRTAMALAATALPVYLTESGREGIFVWSSANLSAAVTSDPLQGVYVPPSSATSGASGAWVRKFEGALNVKWFGAVGNGSTDDYLAIQGALNFLSGGGSLYIPQSPTHYRCSARLVVKAGTHLFGDAPFQSSLSGSHPAADVGSTLSFDANVAGLLFKYINDSDTANSTAIYPGAHYSIVERLKIYSANQAAPSSGKYGIESRTAITIRDVIIQGFGDHGVAIRASLGGSGGSDGVVYGNANKSVLDNVHSISNAGDGFHIEGNDANCIALLSCEGRSNLGWDFYDNALITNTYIGCLSESGGLGSFKVARSDVPHTFIGCHSEGALAELKQGNSVFGGSLGQPGFHAASSLAFVTSAGYAYRYPYVHSNPYGTVSSALGSKENEGCVFQFGTGSNFNEYKLGLNQGGTPALGSWSLIYGGSAAAQPIAFPDGNTRSGRSYACEFPRGIVIGEQGVVGSLSKLVTTGTAAPVTGTWVQGDIVFTRTPVAGGSIGWVCTTGGTPGTWKTFGSISA